MGWRFDLFQKFAVKFPPPPPPPPPPPGLHIAVHPKAGPKKGIIKISPNKTLQSINPSIY